MKNNVAFLEKGGEAKWQAKSLRRRKMDAMPRQRNTSLSGKPSVAKTHLSSRGLGAEFGGKTNLIPEVKRPFRA